jgi:hypothetical protein
MGLLQNSGRPFHLSFVTDLVAIAVLHHSAGREVHSAGREVHSAGREVHSAGIAHLSRRITDGKQYCLVLLLMCCDLGEDEWDQLGAGRSSHHESVLDEEEVSSTTGVDEEVGASATSTSLLTRSKSRVTVPGAESQLSYSLGPDVEEARERRLADISNMNRWQAKRTGVPFLGQDELHKCHGDPPLSDRAYPFNI